MKIKEITLFSNNLNAQKEFYQTTLGFELLEYSSEKISFKAGESILSFSFNETVKPAHMAFNIPSNMVESAFDWLKTKTQILDFEGVEITDFKDINANAIYFYDADGNIMEFIARHNLKVVGDLPFSSSSVLNISEIGVGTDSIESIYNTLNTIKPISIFNGSLNRFCMAGDEEGFFIMVNRNIKDWYPTMEKVELADFIIKGDYNFEYRNGIIKQLS